MTSQDAGIHTCSNCFAEFEWIPFTQNDDDFCCSGCAAGGPCICTYDGAPHVTIAGVTGDSGGDAAGDSSIEIDTEGDTGVAASAASADGGGDEPPDEPPAPGDFPDEEPPANGRLAVIMAAVYEMPLPVQQVVLARLSTEGSDDEIGDPLGLTGEEVRQLIAQGQAILDRAIGPGFTIRYIAAEGIVDHGEPEPEFPPFDQDVEPADETVEDFVPAAHPSELGHLIARSVDSLTRMAGESGSQGQSTKEELAEVLREVSSLFRLASERIIGTSPPEVSLREAFSDARSEEEPITLVVENPGEMSVLIHALQSAQAVELLRLESVSEEKATFRVITGSMMALVQDLMSLEGRLRPSRLQMKGDQITVGLPAEPRDVAAPAGFRPTGQRFELSVDSFFGARHFVESAGITGPPHHHSYRVEAGFISAQPDRQGFVMGFAHVRQLVETTVMDYSETLLNTEEPFLEIAPTTENLAKVFHQKISAKLLDLNQSAVQLKHVRVWESPSNSATYTDFGSEDRHDAATPA